MYAVVQHLHLTQYVDSIQEILGQGLEVILLDLPAFAAVQFAELAEEKGIVLLFWVDDLGAENDGNQIGPIGSVAHDALSLESEWERTLAAS